MRDLSSLLERHRRVHGLPAVAALVLDSKQVCAQGVAGVRRLGGLEKVTLADRWHLGSDTKAMTATLMAVLVERGYLSWSTTIAQALPDLAAEMRPEYRHVTLEMLLANRGGIGHEADVAGLWDRLWQRREGPLLQRRALARIMLAQPPKVPPGRYFYSNCGYAIAGHMAEVVTGTPWEQLLQERVFRPLGIKTAGYGVPWEQLPPAQPWPHNADGSVVTPGALADNPAAIGPAATVHISIDDWSRFLVDQLRGAAGENGLLRADTYRRLHRGRPINKQEGYALGWMVVHRSWAQGDGWFDDGRALHHAGTNNSWFALAWLAPERDFAVLATTNMGGPGVFEKIDAVIWAVIQDHLK